MADRQGQIVTLCAVIGTVVGVISLVVGDFGLFDPPSRPAVSASQDTPATGSVSDAQTDGVIAVAPATTDSSLEQATRDASATNTVPAMPPEVSKSAPQVPEADIEHLITVVGVGRAPASLTSPASRRAAALKAAHIVAKRDLVAWTKGAEIKSVVVVDNASITSDKIIEMVSGRISEVTTVSEDFDPETGEGTVKLALKR